jgi:hypothetical protein
VSRAMLLDVVGLGSVVNVNARVPRSARPVSSVSDAETVTVWSVSYASG